MINTTERNIFMTTDDFHLKNVDDINKSGIAVMPLQIITTTAYKKRVVNGYNKIFAIYINSS